MKPLPSHYTRRFDRIYAELHPRRPQSPHVAYKAPQGRRDTPALLRPQGE